MMQKTRDQAVADQYESYPYPLRDPADEAERLLRPPLDMLGRINHYGFCGRQDFTGGFRALVAGGGTGDAAVFLADQLAPLGGRVVYLDPSRASRAVAEARAQARGLCNITFVSDTIEALPTLGVGPVDYINCTGVLHHLADPAAGLSALASVLKPDGAMALMVYGAHGRRPTTDLRAALAPLVAGLDMTEAVPVAQRLLDHLPENSLFHRMAGGSDFLTALKDNPPEVADLLLHPREIAYDVEGVYALVAEAGLHLSGFSGFLADGGAGKAAYLPDTHLRDRKLLRKLAKLPVPQQQAFCERFSSGPALHAFYVVNSAPDLPGPQDGAARPYLFVPFEDGVLDRLEAGGVRPLELVDGTGTRLDLTPGPDLVRLLRLFDGNHDFDRLCTRLRDEILTPQPVGDLTKVARDTVATVYDLFHRFDWMLAVRPGGRIDRDRTRCLSLEEAGDGSR